jgi:plasmid stabilization system protein ParE
MAYRVSIGPRAERDLEDLYVVIDAQDSLMARRWFRGIERAILSLRQHPNRTPATPENKRLRHLLYGNKPYVYRVIYRVIEKRRLVEVLHIRYGARRRFKRSGLE